MNIPPPVPNYQAFEDANHLRILSICHYIFAAITAFFSCFALLYVFMGSVMVSGVIPAPSGPAGPAGTPAPPGVPASPDMTVMGWFVIVLGVGFFLIGIALAVAKFLAARWLAQRRNATFCYIVAGFECLNLPFGTVLGVFTIVVLSRPSVRALFLAGPAHNNFTHH